MHAVVVRAIIVGADAAVMQVALGGPVELIGTVKAQDVAAGAV